MRFCIQKAVDESFSLSSDEASEESVRKNVLNRNCISSNNAAVSFETFSLSAMLKNAVCEKTNGVLMSVG